MSIRNAGVGSRLRQIQILFVFQRFASRSITDPVLLILVKLLKSLQYSNQCPDGTGQPERQCAVKRRWSSAGEKSRPGTGSLHPVAIEAAAEATKLLKPSV